MRILLTFAGGWGHLDPLLPIARAAAAAGHDVAFVGRPWMVPKVEALGFTCLAAGSDQGLTPERVSLRTAVANEQRGPVSGFGLRIPRERMPDLVGVCKTLGPDLLVWEETDLAGGLVAEYLGILHTRVLVIAEGSFLSPDVLAAPLRELRAEHGLAPDPELAMLTRHLVLSPAPPSFRNPAHELPANAHAMRPAALDDRSDDRLPRWTDRLLDRPTIHLTLGTVFPLESDDLFARAIAGLRELAVNVIVTVGLDFDRSDLGQLPPNVYVEPWLPPRGLLPRCDLVVSHGGSGSVIAALAHGVPLVVMPIGADQPLNAQRCEALGLGRVLDPITSTAEDVREAASTVLADPSYRRAAAKIQQESDALPDASAAVRLMERLITDRRRRHT